MYNLILADLFKLRKSMTIKVLFIITIVSSVIMAMMAHMISQGKINSNMSGIGFMFSDVNMIGILGAVIAGVFICGDFDNKIINDAITNGCSRFAIIASKAVVFSIALAFILIPYAIITGVALSTGSKFSMGSTAVGFLHILTSQSDKTFSISQIWKLIAIMLTLIILYVAQLSICIPLALAMKKPLLVVVIYSGFSILCGQLEGLKHSSALFDHIYACTPYGGNYSFITLDTRIGVIFNAIYVSLVFIIVMLAVAYYGFRKSEIK